MESTRLPTLISLCPSLRATRQIAPRRVAAFHLFGPFLILAKVFVSSRQFGESPIMVEPSLDKNPLIICPRRLCSYGTNLAGRYSAKEKEKEPAMHANSDCIDRDRLRERREQIRLTLEFLGAERLDLQQNAQWVDPEAFRRRMRLFDRLTDWYRHETAQIDNALADADRSDLRMP